MASLTLSLSRVLEPVVASVRRRFRTNWCCSISYHKRYLMAEQGKGGEEEEQWRDCLGQSDASELDNALFFDYEYSIDQLMEIAGLCVAQVN